MGLYLEIPQWPNALAFKMFDNEGTGPTYPHWHKEIEIILAVKGVTRIGVDTEETQLQPGEIYFFASGEPHYFLPSAQSIREVFQFDLSVFNLQLLGLSSTELVAIFEKAARYSATWSKKATDDMTTVLHSLAHFFTDEKRPAKIVGGLYDLLAIFQSELPQAERPSNARKNYSSAKYKEIIYQLNRVYDYIEDHYYEPIKVQDVADLLNFNPQYFTRFFKENTGTTFVSFLNDFRITRASFLLQEELAPMAEIAEKSGFNSAKTFQHTFKDYMGISPLQYRKQQKILNESNKKSVD